MGLEPVRITCGTEIGVPGPREIERTYNRRRRQRRLGKLTPIEYELVHHNLHAHAA